MAEKKKQPTERTLEACRKRGWPAGVVERWKPGFRKNQKTGEQEMIPYGTRVDFLGFADIMAIDGQPGYLAINACAGGGAISAHLQKAMALPELKAHLAAGNRFQVWGWREVWVETGLKTKAVRWRPRIVSVVLRDGMLFHSEEGLSANGERPDSHSGYLAGSSPASPTIGGEHERSSARSFKSVTEGSIPSAPTNSDPAPAPADAPGLFDKEI